jgi:hypothetical protein
LSSTGQRSAKRGRSTKNQRLLLPRLHSNTVISGDAIRRIRNETRLQRGFRDSELAYWLREVVREYHCNAMSGMPWQRVIAHAEAVETAASRLCHLLSSPEAIDCLPSIGAVLDGETTSAFIDSTIARLKKLIERAQLGRKAQHIQCARYSSQKGAGADTILLGGHLPLVFRILYGGAAKGEAPGASQPARERFIAACAKELGLAPPSPSAIKQSRTRYLKAFRFDGAGLMPPREPSADCAVRIMEWVEEVSAAEKAISRD